MSGQEVLTSGLTPGAATAAGAAANRENIISYYMSERESEFTQVQDFLVCAATWNVNGKSPCDSVVEWLVADTPPDIYAIGFQAS